MDLYRALKWANILGRAYERDQLRKGRPLEPERPSTLSFVAAWATTVFGGLLAATGTQGAGVALAFIGFLWILGGLARRREYRAAMDDYRYRLSQWRAQRETTKADQRRRRPWVLRRRRRNP